MTALVVATHVAAAMTAAHSQAGQPMMRVLLLAAYGGDERGMPPELVRHSMADLPPDDADIPRTIVAAVDDDCSARPVSQPGTASVALPDGVAWERAAAVRPDTDGTGLGRRVMAECHRLARAAGAHAVMLHTTTFRVRAVQLYERLGVSRRRSR
jgi:GNAT superfamily N-acetyltransferase